MRLLVIAKISAKQEFTQSVKESLVALLEPTQQEVGNIEYTLLQDVLNPCEFIMYEIWEDKSVFQKHNQMPYLTDFVEKSKTWLTKEIEVEIVEK